MHTIADAGDVNLRITRDISPIYAHLAKSGKDLHTLVMPVLVETGAKMLALWRLAPYATK